MKRLFCLLGVVVLALSSCGEAKPETDSFVSTPGATALMGLPDGGLRYAAASGAVLDVDKDGKGTGTPIASVSEMGPDGILGLVQDQKQRTFASWIDQTSGVLVIAQIAPGPERVVYRGTDKARDQPGGRLALSAENRIYATFTDEKGTGQILSVDPDRNADQIANKVSSGGWNHPRGLAFAAGHVLWVADEGNDSVADRLSRAQPNGPTDDKMQNGVTDEPVAMSSYGDSELVICFAKTGDLRRFLINDGVRVLSGRQLASDCASDVAQLHDGRIAYATKNEIRVTAL